MADLRGGIHHRGGIFPLADQGVAIEVECCSSLANRSSANRSSANR